MANAGVSLRGVKRRRTTGVLYFESRFREGRFYCTKIKSAEEGALCYDIVQIYDESETKDGKRKAATTLNYPEYSRSLQLQALPTNFDIQRNKEEAMEIILTQAQTAAKNLPDNLKQSTPIVCSPIANNRSSSYQNVPRSPPLMVKVEQDLPSVCDNTEVANLRREILRHSCEWHRAYLSKVLEREELERKVADIKEDSGIILYQKPAPDNFDYHMACFKQLISRDETSPFYVQMAEQEYKSDESKCLELQKLLEDHNVNSIPGSLESDTNILTGCRRANESEMLPKVIEDCPLEEHNEFGVDISECIGPSATSPDIQPCGSDMTTRRAEIDVPQGLVSHECDEFAIGQAESSLCLKQKYYRLDNEDEDGRLAEVCANGNTGMPFPDLNPDDWTDYLYILNLPGFSSEDPGLVPGCG